MLVSDYLVKPGHEGLCPQECRHRACPSQGNCHGSTGSPSALSEEDSKGGRDGSRGEQGSSQRY